MRYVLDVLPTKRYAALGLVGSFSALVVVTYLSDAVSFRVVVVVVPFLVPLLPIPLVGVLTVAKRT